MCRTNATAWRLTLLAFVVAIATAMTSAFYPGGEPLFVATKTWMPSALAWIVAQAVWLMMPGLIVSLCFAKSWPKFSFWLGSVWYFGISLIVLCDSVTYHWIAERFLSHKMLAIASELPHGLVQHVPSSTWVFLCCLGLAFIAFAFASLRITGVIANQITGRLPIRWIAVGALLTTIGLAAPALWNLRTTRTAMHHHSARFPLCSLRLYQIRQTTVTQTDTTPNHSSQTSFDAVVQNFQRRRETVSVIQKSDAPRDIVLAIIESMRPELVDKKTMPNLWRYAQKGIHCRYHFSAGNATSHGMFSILNGVDATWYGRLDDKKPLLNHLFHSAGYEVGFFAGHNDWPKFRMDGFIAAEHFDRFQIEPLDWLESDRRATERARAFLDEDPRARPPRLAILYLYCTHADYHSYPNDQIFQPAADNRFLIPFSAAARPAVWNRYKNSAHCTDRFLSAVLAEDRVVVVTGDHGESFLEDGVCGHGTRISKFQNMTPAVIYAPNAIGKTMDAPTSHADLLPSLLAATGLRTNDSSVCSGIDLLSASSKELTDRVVVTRDYLSNEFALVNDSLRSASSPFAMMTRLSDASGAAMLIGPIDEKGNATQGETYPSENMLKNWGSRRWGM